MKLKDLVNLLESEIITVTNDAEFDQLKALGGESGTATAKAINLAFRICGAEAETVKTLEGDTTAKPGDYIMTGLEGEHYVIAGAKFSSKYDGIKTDADGIHGTANKIVSSKGVDYIKPKTAFKAKTWSGVINGKSGDIIVKYGSGDYGIIQPRLWPKLYKS